MYPRPLASFFCKIKITKKTLVLSEEENPYVNDTWSYEKTPTSTWHRETQISRNHQTSVVTCLDFYAKGGRTVIGFGSEKHTCRPNNVELSLTATYSLKILASRSGDCPSLSFKSWIPELGR